MRASECRRFFKRSCPRPPRSVSPWHPNRRQARLAALAASKPGGRLLELGTGTGIGTAWLLSGMDGDARLDTVDVDEQVTATRGGTFRPIRGSRFISRTAPRFSAARPRPTTISSMPMRGLASSRISTTRCRSDRRRYLLHRRSSAPTELAGWTCAKSDSAHRDARAESRFRDGEACGPPA